MDPIQPSAVEKIESFSLKSVDMRAEDWKIFRLSKLLPSLPKEIWDTIAANAKVALLIESQGSFGSAITEINAFKLGKQAYLDNVVKYFNHSALTSEPLAYQEEWEYIKEHAQTNKLVDIVFKASALQPHLKPMGDELRCIPRVALVVKQEKLECLRHPLTKQKISIEERDRYLQEQDAALRRMLCNLPTFA